MCYFDNASSSRRSKYFCDEYKRVFGKARDLETTVKLFRRAEKRIAKLFGITKSDELYVTFLPNATYAINEIAYSLTPNQSLIEPEKIQKQIYLSDAEHASNHLIWLKLAEKPIEYLPLKDFQNWKLPNTPSIFSFSLLSNLEGIEVNPWDVDRKFKEQNHICIVDASQYMQHEIPSLKNSSIDYFFFTAHKFFGPNGIGVICSKLPTDIGINQYNCEQKLKTYLLDLDALEAWIKCLNVIEELFISGFISREVERLHKYFVENFPKKNEYVELVNPESKYCIFLIRVKDPNISCHDYCHYLEKFGIITRSGNCCSWLSQERYDVNKIFRVSLSAFNLVEEIDRFFYAINNFSPSLCL